MKYILFIICITFVSCVTRKNCFEKFPPQVIIKDSTIIKDSLIYHDTTITIPGDTITDYVIINCDSLGGFTAKPVTKKQGRTTLLVRPDAKGLFVICQTDSLNHVIDSLQSVIRLIKNYRTETTIVTPPPVIKYRIPFWLYIVMAVDILYYFRHSIIKLFSA